MAFKDWKPTKNETTTTKKDATASNEKQSTEDELGEVIMQMKETEDMTWAQICKELAISKKDAQKLYKEFINKREPLEHFPKPPKSKGSASVVVETGAEETQKETANKAKKRILSP